MSAGNKRNRVRIEQRVLTSDGQGGHVTTWTLRAVVYAHERPLTGREAIQAGQVTAVRQTVLEIWYRTDIDITDRVLIGTRTLAINDFFDPTDTRDDLFLFCSEVVGETRAPAPAVDTWVQEGWMQ